ncbi:MAG TPA: TetR/AcrR family transcriptional regulator [Rhizomicrobium sp.]|nr:TetR/AcrR family transcriptional regulator [Rhizomicrobium sp.]
MARPKSDDRRDAILAAATRVIAAEGLSAPTAAIAKEAGVSNGSLFTYFETKADLLNHLYLEIKTEAAEAALGGKPPKGDIRKQAQQSWARSLEWAMEFPDKRRVLALLTVSDDITPASKAKGHQIMAGVAAQIDQSRRDGPMRNAPLLFVVAIMNAIMDSTVEFIQRDKANAEKHSKAGFEAVWRAIA